MLSKIYKTRNDEITKDIDHRNKITTGWISWKITP